MHTHTHTHAHTCSVKIRDLSEVGLGPQCTWPCRRARAGLPPPWGLSQFLSCKTEGDRAHRSEALLSSWPWGACLEPWGLHWDTAGLGGDPPGGKGRWAPGGSCGRNYGHEKTQYIPLG